MADPPQPSPRSSNGRGRAHIAILLFLVVVVSSCGVTTAWWAGVFTSNGRFDGLDACTLLPPPNALAPLVASGAREPGSSRPVDLLGGTGGDLMSECKWSSVPQGQDRPFRTVRVYTETKDRYRRTSAEAEAEQQLSSWKQRDSRVQPVDFGEDGYTAIDVTELHLLVVDTTIYDVHAKFRISNALIDVSARTHTKPDGKTSALLYGLAKNVAQRLEHKN